MTKKYILLAVFFGITILFSCEKEENPTGGNKIEMGSTSSSAVSYFSATVSSTPGSVKGNTITQHGHCWSTNQNPTTNDNKTTLGSLSTATAFTSSLEDLLPNTTYYVRSYLTTNLETIYGGSTTFKTLKTGVPVATTTDATEITVNSAICGGTVVSDSGLFVIEYGLVWDTLQTFTYEKSLGKVKKGEDLGSFTHQLTNLSDGVNYYVRAYAKNDAGVGYGEIKAFSTVGITVPEVSTTAISSITTNSAQGGGEVTADGNAEVTARGIVWSTSENPTVENNSGKTTDEAGLGTFTSQLAELQDGTSYYVRSYATNERGTGYGNEVEFTTIAVNAPIVSTSTITTITAITASSGGNVTSDGNTQVTTRGVCWSTTPNPTISNNKTADGSGKGAFTSNITGLLFATKYYVRAYATNEEGTSYGEQKEFTTESVKPSVSTNQISNITANSATTGGTITLDGGATITTRGVCWDTNPSPTVNNSKTSDGAGTGAFTSQLTNLIPGETYYVRAYATNTKGISYGEEIDFTAGANIPVVTTTSVSEITINFAKSGGNVISEEGAPVTARGVIWGTSTNPSLESNSGKTTDGTGLGVFTSQLAELQDGTTYFVRAYASNEKGTAYGDAIEFVTIGISVPKVTTVEVTNVTETSAQSGGNVTSDGNTEVTARGIVWSTSSNPTLENNLGKTTDGTETGSFTSQLNNLQKDETYYVRAYASNEKGTSYGDEESFTTPVLSGTFTDSRDGNNYNFIIIGTQTWMAENLAYLPSVSPSSVESYTEPYFYVYGYSGTSVSSAKANNNYGTYGVLYNWPATQAACPSGWHLPTDAEWTELEDYLTNNGYGYGGSGDDIAKSLAAKTNWNSDTGTGTIGNDPGSNNSSGFSGLPGGYRSYGGGFDDIISYGTWWSTTEYGSGTAWGRTLTYTSTSVSRNGTSKEYGFSVRCVRD